jgi:transposase-like protein
MISPLLCSDLVLFALLWLCLLLFGVWLYKRAGMGPTPPTPGHPPRTCAREPTPFAGLTHKPPCAACAHSPARLKPLSPTPPPRLSSLNRRPRQVDTSEQFCPYPPCVYWGWTGLENIRANGYPNGGRWRQFQCLGCKKYFLETLGTPLHGKRVAPELLVWAVGALAEGLGIRAVARVFEVDPNTVLHWLVDTADHAAAFSQHFLHDVHVTQVQLDELFALLSAVKAEEVSAAKAIQRLAELLVEVDLRQGGAACAGAADSGRAATRPRMDARCVFYGWHDMGKNVPVTAACSVAPTLGTDGSSKVCRIRQNLPRGGAEVVGAFGGGSFLHQQTRSGAWQRALMMVTPRAH